MLMEFTLISASDLIPVDSAYGSVPVIPFFLSDGNDIFHGYTAR